MSKKTILLAFLLCLLLPAVMVAEESLSALSYGSQGERVTALQEKLTALGYYTFRITGNYQENTRAAVRAFQEDNGFEATGVADEALQRLILSEYAMPKPTPTPQPTLVPVAYPGKLEYGSQGDHVRRVQERLAALGFYGINVSGEFLKNTRSAVRDFQRQNGLKEDGVVGEETWEWLFFREDAVDVSATPRPSPSPTPVPYKVGVDVANQVTTVYSLDEMGGYTQIVRHMICSTGTDKDPTPLGSFILSGATARWCYFPKWGTHAQYWTRIDAANAFHSVIYSQADPMMLKTGSYTGLGKPASHGCIRLMVADAKWIYENIGEGTEVFVYEGVKDEEMTKSLKIPSLDYSVMLPVATAEPTPQPAYDAQALPPMPFTTLEKGVESEAVYWLQCKLTEMGYYKGSITGGYYSGTVEAVKAFQRDHGLSVDGKAGKNTLSVLYADVLATPMPVPEPEPTPAAIPSPSPAPTAPPIQFAAPPG